MNDFNNIFKYWGKYCKETKQYHLLVYHCLDVAAVADVWLSESNVLLNQIATSINKTKKEARAIILFYVLLHDLGKFDARFQNFVEDVRITLQGGDFEVEQDSQRYSHGSFGYMHFCSMFPDHVYPYYEAMKAVAGHHGYCDTTINPDLLEPDADDELIELDIQARQEWIDFCLQWTGLNTIPESLGEIPMLAGLCSVSDWIGSSITNFSQDPSENITTYYQSVLPRAKQALLDAGMLTVLNGSGFDFLFSPYKPIGIQTLLSSISQLPGLMLVESDTGSGKTEFALSYASMLIGNGLADGIVFGLPTQATANGLFDRIGNAAKKLFPDSTVTLAHGKSKYLLPDENGFLHQSNKRAFLGSMSVATIDQILMGVLGVKHQFIRSFGTRKSVLILDEIHSFDSYMYALIEKVLQGQHQVFSSVILLSATLPTSLKNKLLATYGGKSESLSYPLVTHCDCDGNIQEYTLDFEPKRKEIEVKLWKTQTLLPSFEQICELLEWAKQGAMVGIVCNTVSDAQQLYSSLKDEMINSEIEVDLFHARYTFADRKLREDHVLKTYGKGASRKGRILVATQVIEQSLDLDFDVLVSQIAPIEFLMQRMGRLWRHDRENTDLAPRTKSISMPKFITLVPKTAEIQDGKTHYQGSGFVYSNIRTLYRTENYLNQKEQLVFPDCYRDAIEYVHAEKVFNNEPELLTQLFEAYQAQQSGSAYTAKMYSILDSKPLNDVDPRCALLTREGEMSATVVLLNSDGELWHGGDYHDQQDRDQSTVSISKKHAKGQMDSERFCIKAVVGTDIQYSELGIEFQR